jgi:excisionase family DNA binding protein
MRHVCQSERMTDSALLTTTQAAALLGKSARTVQRLAESGDLEAAQKLAGPNGAYLFKDAVVIAYGDKHLLAEVAGGQAP